ncbi:MAG: FG-GAP repeat protein, partial [Bacteroidetes bacterium]|nr:FG-GAP repeat protein [Bacteroidota bacterium]
DADGRDELIVGSLEGEHFDRFVFPTRDPEPLTRIAAIDFVEFDGTSNTQFGLSLAAGDLDNDGYPELAVGVPNYKQNGVSNGAVFLIRGSENFLDLTHRQLIKPQKTPPAGLMRYGQALRISDVDADGVADLVVGAPSFADSSGLPPPDDFIEHSGAAEIFIGGQTSLDPSPTYRVTQSATGNAVLAYQNFGGTLHSADLNGDGFDELLVAAPSNLEQHPGFVAVFAGQSSNAGIVFDRILQQNTVPLPPPLKNINSTHTTHVGGDATPIDGSEPFVIEWEDALDPDDGPLFYRWQAYVDGEDSAAPTLDIDTGGETSVHLTVSELADYMAAHGKPFPGDTLVVRHRIIVSDWADTTSTTDFRLTLVRGVITSSEDEKPADAFFVSEPYPNPVGNRFILSYSTGGAEVVDLRIIDITGREVIRMILPPNPAAATASVDVGSLASGVYLVETTSGTMRDVRRFVKR